MTENEYLDAPATVQAEEEAEQQIRDAMLLQPVYVAWNERQRVRVGWLGVAETQAEMDERLKKYEAPKHILSVPSDHEVSCDQCQTLKRLRNQGITTSG